MNNGRRLNLFCRMTKVAGDLGRTTVAWSRAYSGCSKPVRAGAICPGNIPAQAPAGGACNAGRNAASGSISGERFFPNWTNATSSIGVKVFWMAVSLRLKKGLRRRQNQAGQRHEVDGGGRRRGCSFGSPIGQRQSGRSEVGRRHSGPALRAAKARPAADTSLAHYRRSRLRQRSVAVEIAATGHSPDLSAPPRALQTFPQRRANFAPLSQPLENRAHLRLARQLPPSARTL